MWTEGLAAALAGVGVVPRSATPCPRRSWVALIMGVVFMLLIA